MSEVRDYEYLVKHCIYSSNQEHWFTLYRIKRDVAGKILSIALKCECGYIEEYKVDEPISRMFINQKFVELDENLKEIKS